MASKPELVVFNQYKIGGVQNFYYNILSNDPYKEFDVKWIFVDDRLTNDPKPLELYNITNEIVYRAPADNSLYNISRSLRKLISPERGVVITNFDPELSTLHLYPRSKKTIVFICHDELYVARAVCFDFMIDVFIAHNEFFYHQMIEKLPHRKGDIYFIPYGVSVPGFKRVENATKRLDVVIAARLTVNKGVYDLVEIDKILKSRGTVVNWTIIGDGPEKEQLLKLTKDEDNFTITTLPNNNAVLQKLSMNDVFILPSRLDGLPVAMLESMSVGCVPVISAFNPGIYRVVTDDVGFVLPVGDNEAFANAIDKLDKNRALLEQLSKNALKKISEEYNIKSRAKEYFDLFSQFEKLKKQHKFKFPNYGGYLNHPWLPRFISSPVKKVKSLLAK